MNNDTCPLPPLDLLGVGSNHTTRGNRIHTEEDEVQQRLIRTLAAFRIKVGAGPITRGPRFTRYEFIPPEGLRLSRIAGLRDELKLAAGARPLRFLTPVPGKNTVGIELPNRKADSVRLRDLLEESQHTPSMFLPIALGKDVAGGAHMADLARLPHLLIAGCTGSGKSVFLRSMLMSLLLKLRPQELRLMLIDPTEQDLTPYATLPHLACPVITEAGQAIRALRWGEKEMRRRSMLLRTRNLLDRAAYNRHAIEPLPSIVIAISELADLMMEVKDELEGILSRLTLKAGGVGIHLVAATQTVRSTVLTGKLKAHIPSRLAFRVISSPDSRIILDTHGAEDLLGKGDFLFQPQGGLPHLRGQGAFVSDDEVKAVVQYLAQHFQQSFDRDLMACLDAEGREGHELQKGGDALLSLVTWEGDTPCVQFLQNEGVHPNGGRDDGRTPLHEDCANLLLQHGATPCPPPARKSPPEGGR